MASRVVVAEYSAEGGPEKAFMAPDGHEAGPTDAGEYVIAYCAKHRSRRYPQWSSIPWGSPLKHDSDRVLVFLDGRWHDVFKLTGASPDAVESYHAQLYGTEKIPDKWVFNDFGHLTCYMFKDLNRNGRLDPATEKIHGEFFHTTPPDEAATSLHTAVKLDRSHGCIHLKPLELDEMVRRKFMRKGAHVVVHRYNELLVRFPRVLAPRLMNSFLSGAAQASDRGHRAVTGHRALLWAIVASVGWLAASACSRGDALQTRDAPRPTADASRPATLLGCVLGVAVGTRQGGLSPEAAARLCHGSVSPTEVATSWEVRTPFSDLSIIGNRAFRPTEPALEYSMTIDLGSRVVLRALATELGPYSTVAESKTSSVRFNAPGATGQVFAELFSSKVLPDAPVIRVVARAPHLAR